MSNALESAITQEPCTVSKDCLQKAISILVNAHCCDYCVLRLLGLKTLALYQQSSSSLHALLSSVCPSISSYTHPADMCCPLCGDSIALCHSEEFRSSLSQTIKSCDYEYECYILNIRQPVAFSIRQRAMWLYLEQELGSDNVISTEDTVVDVKEAMKWILGPYLGPVLGVPFKHDSLFRVNLIIECTGSDAEATSFLSNFNVRDPRTGRPLRLVLDDDSSASTGAVLRVLRSIPPALFSRHFSLPPAPLPTSSKASVKTTFWHDSIFIAGRYNKYSSRLPQTPWLLPDGTRLHETSVEEIITGPLAPFLRADSLRFSASGREDVDVRMLGNGRPFLIEAVNPRRAVSARSAGADMQKAVNDSGELVQIAHVQVVSAAAGSAVKEAEGRKVKHYRALVWTSRAVGTKEKELLEGIKDLKVLQLTPLRVLHRRSLATREKVILGMQIDILSPHFFVLNVRTSAGTYVKEFVHGDLGRTQPNIGSLLGCSADILQLDVTAVETEFPEPCRPCKELPHSFCVPESFFLADREEENKLEPDEKRGKIEEKDN